MASGSTGPGAAACGGFVGSEGSCKIGVQSGVSSECPLADCVPVAVSGSSPFLGKAPVGAKAVYGYDQIPYSPP